MNDIHRADTPPAANPSGSPFPAAPALGSPAPDTGAATVDDRNPWLGLASFTEETQSYFYGRDDEVAELARRVQRKLLTVLFGQSGLGKTSILRAGLVPRLRAQGYCPVYVRIGYGRDAPEPAEQIKQAIARSARRAGEWTQAGVATEGESLWEYMHHRDDVLQDGEGNTLMPLLIFDQFEEIFTLAQSDEFGRARAARFIADLADLVENRPPQALEAKLETDDSAAERFDFARSDYRVLIALREDYLAPLEGLKGAMPSITQNRLRLAPMTGSQALAAVMKPGRGLVSEDVAAAIVRFVAGGAELANAEVEPSLLSLICRELNDARIAQGRDEISLDLLAGSHATILQNFYERALADQPPAVRRIVEDQLLTASGYRENVAEENLVASLNAAGAAPDTVALLVNRRLLRIEERLDVRRVELTHDVLCGVVKSSRDLRQERESREATERLLADQRDRELATRRALVSARQIAAGCIVLALGAVAAAILAYISNQRAHRAERIADQTRAQAEQARTGAEHLLGYLTDDFVRELLGFGRINMIAEFSQRQIDYFKSLPPALRGAETIRNGALAMNYHSRAMRQLGNLQEGIANASESIQLLERLRTAGDTSEATAIALAQAYTAKASILDNQNSAEGPPTEQRAVEILQPLAAAPGASAAVRRGYLETLIRVGFEYYSSNQPDACVTTSRQAMQLATDLGARDLKDVDAAANYVEAGAWYSSCLGLSGRNAEALKAGEDVLAVSDQVLAQRPGHRLALHGAQVTASGLTLVASNELNPTQEVRFSKLSEQISETLLGLDPHNVTSLNNLGVAHQGLGDALWSAGKLSEAMRYYQRALDDFGAATPGGSGFQIIHAANTLGVAISQARLGDGGAAAATLAAESPYLARMRQNEAPGAFPVMIVENIVQVATAEIAYAQDDFDRARHIAADSVNLLKTAKTEGSFQESQVAITAYDGLHVMGRVDYLHGDYAAAEREEREALADRKQWSTEGTQDKRDLAEISTWLAMSLAKEGKFDDALREIEPVVKFQRDLSVRNHGDVWQPTELAAALYAQALADPPHRAALLKEGAALLDAAPPQLKSIRMIRQWRERVSQAQHG
jgi:tetratricopeptide (TPR) repeat protein